MEQLVKLYVAVSSCYLCEAYMGMEQSASYCQGRVVTVVFSSASKDITVYL